MVLRCASGHASKAAEFLGPVSSGGDVPYTKVAEVGAEDVLPVAFAVHPPQHRRFGGGVSVGDVFSPAAPGVTGRRDAITPRAAIRAGVGEVAVVRHVLGMRTGGGGQAVVRIEGKLAVLAAFLVNQGEYREFLIGHVGLCGGSVVGSRQGAARVLRCFGIIGLKGHRV